MWHYPLCELTFESLPPMPPIQMDKGDFQAVDQTAQSGRGYLAVDMVSGQSAVTSTWATSPLKILVPQARGRSVWAYVSSFGGGLVAGDQTRLELDLGAGTCAFAGTQAATKVYRNPSRRPCSHSTRARVAARAVLVFAPDPVQAFADSTYTQRQEFRLEADSGLLLTDWFTSGRAARGERWCFSRFESRNEVFIAGKRIFLDSIRLDSAREFNASAHQTGRFNCFAMLLMVGRGFKEAAERVLVEMAGRPVARREALVMSASPIGGGVLIRLAGEGVEAVGRELREYLKTAAPLLGDDPWARKW